MLPASDGVSPIDLSRVLTPYGELVEKLGVEDLFELALSYAPQNGAWREERLLKVHDVRLQQPWALDPATSAAQCIMRVVLEFTQPHCREVAGLCPWRMYHL